MITIIDNLYDGIVEEVSDPTYTFAQTLSGSAEILIVAISVYGSANEVETVTWDGVPMIIDLHKNNGGTECVIAHLQNPATDKLDLVIGISGDTSSVNVGLLTASGVSKISPVNSSAFFNTDVAEGHSLEITTSQDGCLIVDCVQSGAVNTVSGYETVVYADETNDVSGCQYYEQSSKGLKSMDWSWGGEDTTTHILVAFEPISTNSTNFFHF